VSLDGSYGDNKRRITVSIGADVLTAAWDATQPTGHH
jgi:hypothetical protein